MRLWLVDPKVILGLKLIGGKCLMVLIPYYPNVIMYIMKNNIQNSKRAILEAPNLIKPYVPEAFAAYSAMAIFSPS